MTKAERLKILDDLVLNRMIKLIETNETHLLPELSNAVSLLKANQVVEPPNRGETDPVEERKRKLAEVKKRRE